jgi:MarR family transcriptional regulator, transcriptional regulator for hemolysin
MRKKTELTIGYLIHECARLYRRDFEKRAKAIGLTRAQWTVLAHLARNEGANQISVADTLEIQPITLARTIDRMAEADWIERRADPLDRRARLLFLTEKAWSVLDQMHALGKETRDVALQGLGPDDQDRLTALLIRMRANLQTGDASAQDQDPSLKAHHA